MNIIRRIGLAFLASATCVSIAVANDLIVSPGGSIQTAADTVADGDRVLVHPGTHHERIDLSGKAIQVIGVGGAAQTVLDADLVGTAVSFLSGEGPASRLAGFTITRGTTQSLQNRRGAFSFGTGIRSSQEDRAPTCPTRSAQA